MMMVLTEDDVDDGVGEVAEGDGVAVAHALPRGLVVVAAEPQDGRARQRRRPEPRRQQRRADHVVRHLLQPHKQFAHIPPFLLRLNNIAPRKLVDCGDCVTNGNSSSHG